MCAEPDRPDPEDQRTTDEAGAGGRTGSEQLGNGDGPTGEGGPDFPPPSSSEPLAQA